MKFNYCPSCGVAYKRSWLERDRCVGCGEKGTRVVKVKMMFTYFLAYAAFILGAVMIVLYNDSNIKWFLFIGFFVAGAMLAVTGMNQMRDKAIQLGEGLEKPEEEDQ